MREIEGKRVPNVRPQFAVDEKCKNGGKSMEGGMREMWPKLNEEGILKGS
jgi:hypothetical protein